MIGVRREGKGRCVQGASRGKVGGRKGAEVKLYHTYFTITI